MSSGLAVNLDLGEERVSLEMALCRVWGSVLAGKASWQLGIADGHPLLAVQRESQQCESEASRPPGPLGPWAPGHRTPPLPPPPHSRPFPGTSHPCLPATLNLQVLGGAGPSPVSLGPPLKLCGVIPPCAWAPSHGCAFTRSFPLSLLLSPRAATGSSSCAGNPISTELPHTVAVALVCGEYGAGGQEETCGFCSRVAGCAASQLHCPVVTRLLKDITTCSGRREGPQWQESLEAGERASGQQVPQSVLQHCGQKPPMAPTDSDGWGWPLQRP